MNQKQRFFKKSVEAADGLSLGISIVVAVLMGVGIGWGLETLSGVGALFWLGVAIGVAAAVLNVYKAYKAQVAAYEGYDDEFRYKVKIKPKADESPKNNEKPKNETMKNEKTSGFLWRILQKFTQKV